MRLPPATKFLGVLLAVGCDRTASPPDANRQPNPAAVTHPATQASSPPATLRQRLTGGRWVRDLSTPGHTDRFVYTFAPDGTYANTYISDYSISVTGRWELSRDDSGADHLGLQGHEGSKDYYWLGADSIVRFDEATGNLLVSGPRYVGQVPLIHEE